MDQNTRLIDLTVAQLAEIIDKAVEEQLQVLSAQLARQGLSLEMYCSFMNTTEKDILADMAPTAEASLRNQAAIEKIVELEKLEENGVITISGIKNGMWFKYEFTED